MDDWRDISFLPGYQVSAQAQIRNAKTGHIKKMSIANSGYPVFGAYRDTWRVFLLHDVVADAFLGLRPKGMQINHIDGVKTNSLPENLEYCTPIHNVRHAIRTGLTKQHGQNNWGAKLTDADVIEIRKLASEGARTVDLARTYGVGQPIISQIKHGTRWKHLL